MGRGKVHIVLYKISPPDNYKDTEHKYLRKVLGSRPFTKADFIEAYKSHTDSSNKETENQFEFYLIQNCDIEIQSLERPPSRRKAYATPRPN